MPAGSFISLAPSIPHIASMDEETVVQLNNLSRLPQEKRT
jgi:hypothetical protein